MSNERIAISSLSHFAGCGLAAAPEILDPETYLDWWPGTYCSIRSPPGAVADGRGPMRGRRSDPCSPRPGRGCARRRPRPADIVRRPPGRWRVRSTLRPHRVLDAWRIQTAPLRRETCAD